MMDWSLQQTYYLVASLAGIIATSINVVLFMRSRPDRMKAKVAEAVAPFELRLQSLERESTEAKRQRGEAQRRHDASLKALDADINGKLASLGARSDAQHRETTQQLQAQSIQLTRIATQLEHGVSRQQVDTVHHRVTELAKTVSESAGVIEGLQTLVHNIDDFLREGGRE